MNNSINLLLQFSCSVVVAATVILPETLGDGAKKWQYSCMGLCFGLTFAAFCKWKFEPSDSVYVRVE